MSDRLPTLQIKYNTPYPVQLLYDNPKQGESQYGKYNLYGLEYNGEQYGLFAEDALHDELKQYNKGSKVVIRRDQGSQGQLLWQVSPQNGGSRSTSTIEPLDKRTLEIYRSLSLKIAVQSIGQSLQKWGPNELSEIQNRMEQLLSILTQESKDELPF